MVGCYKMKPSFCLSRCSVISRGIVHRMMGPALLLLSMLPIIPTSSMEELEYPDYRLKQMMDVLMRSEFYKLFPTRNYTKPVYFILYKKVNGRVIRSVTTLKNDGLLHDGILDRRHPLKIGLHGWQQDMNSRFVTTMVPAYIESIENVQVVIVRWTSANQNYLFARLSILNTARTIYRYCHRISMQYRIALESMTIVGHSMGAQLAGAVGNIAQGLIGTIVALEPANPLFWKHSKDVVGEESARRVIGVHTSPGYYGVEYNVGHVDFWPNFGRTPQPGCESLPQEMSSNVNWDIPNSSEDSGQETQPTKSDRTSRTWYSGILPNDGQGFISLQRNLKSRGERNPSTNTIFELACSHEKSIELFFNSVRGELYLARKCHCICEDVCEINRWEQNNMVYFSEQLNAFGQYCFPST